MKKSRKQPEFRDFFQRNCEHFLTLSDEIEYIDRTVNYLNSLSDGKVIAFVIAPFSIKKTATGIKMKVLENSDAQVVHKRKELYDYFSVPVFEFSEIEELGNKIIDYFGE